jgi:hypothetical protein
MGAWRRSELLLRLDLAHHTPKPRTRFLDILTLRRPPHLMSIAEVDNPKPLYRSLELLLDGDDVEHAHWFEPSTATPVLQKALLTRAFFCKYCRSASPV